MLRRTLAAALAVVATAPGALADEPGEPIALEYGATSDCPDAVAFDIQVTPMHLDGSATNLPATSGTSMATAVNVHLTQQ